MSYFCKNNLKLHKDQIKAWKNRCAIDIVAIIVEEIYKSWNQKKVARLLFIDVKNIFDYVFKIKLA